MACIGGAFLLVGKFCYFCEQKKPAVSIVSRLLNAKPQETMRKFLISFLLCVLAIPASWAGPRYIFYFIGDGMGMGHILLAQTFNRLTGEFPLAITEFPVGGQVTTFSASSPVTDSAAAGTALATGTKTRNNIVGMGPDSTAIESLVPALQKMGYGIGIISSNAPDDATPASFYGHVPSRHQHYDIGCQAANSGINFIGGARMRGFKDKNGKPTDLQQRLNRAGVVCAYDSATVMANIGRRVLMASPDTALNNTLGYAIDYPEASLTLPRLTDICLQYLERTAPDQFFMMIENGMTDWASHANDAGTLVREVNVLNEAIEVAVRFYLQHPQETLIVVTADHDTGGVSLGNSNPEIKYDAHPELLALQKVSKEAFTQQVSSMMRDRRRYTWEEMKEVLGNELGFWKGINPTPEEEHTLHTLFDKMQDGNAGEGQKTLYASFDDFSAEVFRVMDQHTGVGWISTYHTGNMVPVYAMGLGAERFSGLIDNTQIPRTILQLVQTRTVFPRQK